MKNRIVLLGTGTCQIQTHRMASSVLIENEGTRVVFDFGRGVSQRLVELDYKQADISHIILSHFHPDHISDLIPFLQAACWSRSDPRKIPLTIYGPQGLKVQMMRLVGLFGTDELIRPTFELNLVEVREGPYRIDGQEFVPHSLPPAGNHGIKFEIGDKKIGLTGDSYYHPELVSFMKGLDVAIIDSGHPTISEIVSAAVSSQARQVVCSHLYSELDESELNSLAKEAGYKGKFIVPQDLWELEF